MRKRTSASATKIPLDSLSPYDATLVKVHLGDTAGFKALDGFSKLVTQIFIFDLLDGIEIGLESEDKCFGLRQTMQSLALNADECLEGDKS